MSRYVSVAGALALFASHAVAATAVRLVSFNVHGPVFKHSRIERMHAVAKEVIRRDPDFILLQEVWLRSDVALFANALEPRGYVRVQKHSCWPFHVSGLLIFVNRNHGWIVDRFDHHRYRRHGPWWRLREADGVSQKGFLRADVHKGATSLTLVVTHTQAQYGERTYHEIRQQQIEQLIDYTKPLDSTRPVVLAGDFNTAPTGQYDGPVYNKMIAVWDELTKDARDDCLNDHNPALIEPLACGTHYEGDRLSNEWIDYVFARIGDKVQLVKLEPIRNEASDQPFSDHEGVDAEMLVP